MDPTRMTDEELEAEARRLRDEVVGAARRQVMHEARTARSISPIEVAPPRETGGPSEETAWIVIGVVTLAVTLFCGWLTLP